MRHLNSRHLMVLILALFTLSASAGSAQPTDQGVVRPLTIELSSFKFTPATLQLQRGTTYRIHFVNVSSGGHNFVAREFFAASTIAATDQGKVHDAKSIWRAEWRPILCWSPTGWEASRATARISCTEHLA
jgi:plastocyanin